MSIVRADPAATGMASLSKSSYSLRPLRPDDLESISRVHWRACRVAYRFMDWSYSEEEVRLWYAGKLDEWDWGRVAEAGGAVVGYLAAIGAHIDQLFVDPDHQRLGVGSLLLGAVLERRLRPATLHVFERNALARHFYARFGFRQVDGWWDATERAVSLVYRLD